MVFSLAAVLLPIAASASDRSQEKPYALIFGTVWDPDGHPIYGVKVKIRRTDAKKGHWEVYSNHTGEFAQRVPAGKADYAVTADVKGYKSLSGKRLQAGPEVTVHIDNDERADVGLHLTW
jgi:Carboxypeptidase regulatory-like domain